MSNTTTTVTPLSEKRRDTILNDLLDSYLAVRKPTSLEMSEVTRKIARRRNVTVQQVAGVRAALSSERYGSITTLLTRRRKALKAAA